MLKFMKLYFHIYWMKINSLRINLTMYLHTQLNKETFFLFDAIRIAPHYKAQPVSTFFGGIILLPAFVSAFHITYFIIFIYPLTGYSVLFLCISQK